MYDVKKNLRGDLFGGISAGIVALPLAMAFGVESGLGAAAGLVGAVVLSLIASMIGGTPLLISGPTAPITVVTSLMIADQFDHQASPEKALTTIFVIFLLSGFFQIVFGWLKVGQYIRFVPYPLISGFTSGVGIMMVIIQILPLTGHSLQIHIAEIFKSVYVMQNLNAQALSLGMATILIVYLFPKITKAIPSTLAALVVVSLAAYALRWKVPVIGDIPDTWMKWHWSHLISFDQAQWSDVILPSVTLALLGSIDTLLTSLVLEMVGGARHKSNTELIGQGVGNMLSAVAGGLPGAGATMRSVFNIRSGAKTTASVVVHSIFLMIVFFEIGSISNYIPVAVLAGILITVGISIIDYKSLRDVLRIPKSDAVVMMVVMFVTIAFGLLQAFAIGVILASLFFVKKMADQNMAPSNPIVLIPENEEELIGLNPIYQAREVYIQELSGPLFFGFASHFKEAIEALPYVRAVIFRMEQVPFIDQSGIHALQDVLKNLRKRNVVVVFTGLQKEPTEQLEKMQIIPHIIKEEWVFRSFSHASDWLAVFLKNNPSDKLGSAIQKKLEIKNLHTRMN